MVDAKANKNISAAPASPRALTVRISPELHQAVNDRLTREDSFQALIVDLLEKWLRQGAPVLDRKKEDEVPPHLRTLVRKLVKYLDSRKADRQNFRALLEEMMNRADL